MSEPAPVRERAQLDPGRSRDLQRPPAPEPLAHEVADAHCHLDIRDGESWLSVSEAVEAAAAVGVTRIMQIGCDLVSSRWSVDVARDVEAIWAGVALHPNEAPRIAAEDGPAALAAALDEIEALAAQPQVRTIGETGMDFYRTGVDGRAVQEESFRRHIDIAKKTRKPLMIHDRDAHLDVVRVLDSEGAPDVVVFHCFSGDADFARLCAERGWVMSFAGTVSFKNAASLREACAVAPADQILVETDAPFLTPMPYRGRPNASYLIPLTVRAMAAARGEHEDDVARAVGANAERIFGPW